jgi:16S rRNA (cytidine1402-2'-O)-methyltransferase
MSTLTLLTLPIGNPDDITLRALEHLKSDGFILAEDTRELVKLLRHYGIETKDKTLESFHDHSQEKLESLVHKMKQGLKMTIVSDAGSPMISDPAYPLVKHALSQNVELLTIPGVSSVIASLELSGLPPIPFHFYGFLPRESDRQRDLFLDCLKHKGTSIFFESPHRLKDSLELLSVDFPDAQIALGRELTKTYETCYRFLARDFPTVEIRYQGEFVVCVDFRSVTALESKREQKLKAMAREMIEEGAGSRRLSKLLAEITGDSAKDIYKVLAREGRE